LFYEVDVESGLGGNGLTVPNPYGISAHAAFEGRLELNGGIALVPGAPQIQYKFEWAPTDVNGNPTGPWTTVPGDKILETPIGQFITSAPLHHIVEVQVNGSNTPTSYSIAPTADDWITVPPNFPPWPSLPPPIPPSALEFIPTGKLAT